MEEHVYVNVDLAYAPSVAKSEEKQLVQRDGACRPIFSKRASKSRVFQIDRGNLVLSQSSEGI
jgi:hypothetical protein